MENILAQSQKRLEKLVIGCVFSAPLGFEQICTPVVFKEQALEHYNGSGGFCSKQMMP